VELFCLAFGFGFKFGPIVGAVAGCFVPAAFAVGGVFKVTRLFDTARGFSRPNDSRTIGIVFGFAFAAADGFYLVQRAAGIDAIL